MRPFSDPDPDPESRPATDKGSGAQEAHGHRGTYRRERRRAVITVVAPFVGLIFAVVLLWGRWVSWLDLALLGLFYLITMVGVGVGFHRYFTHRSFQTKQPIRAFLGIAGCMAAQGPVSYWVGIHRIHHSRSDREGDPHSPHCYGDGRKNRIRGFFHAHFGWVILHQIDGRERTEAAFDLLMDPLIHKIDRHYLTWIWLGLAIPAVLGGLLTGSWFGAFTGFIWGGLVRMALVHHSEWSINSICHLFGRSPFRTRDESRNNAWVGLLAFGDGWHNNHHKFPTSAMHGLKWWQFDLNGLLIRLLEAVGLAWDVVRVSPERIEKAEAETAQSSA